MFFREIGIETTSPAQMLAFYAEILGLPTIAGAEDEAAVRAGATTLRFRSAAPRTKPSYHFALRVPGPAFADAKAWLAARTQLVSEDGQDEFDWDIWGARAVYSYDPAGNVIELIAFPSLDSPGETHFVPESLLGVAELGFPVADPHAAATQLAHTFGIGLWDHEEVTPDSVPPDQLTPVGEQGATFLLSPLGRPWLFGGPAEDHALDIVLGGVREGTLKFDEHPYRITASG
jgi:catechol 2,3-dioxygenase-like lactoylglutathione lyase family enzyme